MIGRFTIFRQEHGTSGVAVPRRIIPDLSCAERSSWGTFHQALRAAGRRFSRRNVSAIFLCDKCGRYHEGQRR